MENSPFMHVMLNNSTLLKLPIFFIVNFSHDDHLNYFYIFLRIVEFLLIVISALLTLSSILIAATTTSWHFNVSLIYLVFGSQWFELLISRVMIAPYQEGFIRLREIGVSFTSTSSLHSFSGDLYLSENLLTDYCLVLGSCLRSHYLTSVCFALPAIVIERMFSVYFIHDYERIRRAYISIILLFFAEIFGTILAYCCITETISLATLDVIFCVITMLSYLTYLKVQSVSKKLLKKCKTNVNFYTLSVKYQLAENDRAMKLIHIVILETCTIIIMVVMLITIGYFKLFENIYQAYLFIFVEFLVHINPIFIVPGTLYITPTWKRSILHFAPEWLRQRVVEYLRQKNQRIVDTTLRISPVEQAAAYFEQLQRVW